MANKRMFTLKIVDSDAFLDMPLSAQCLYFHLNMRADDDGFIGNVKRIMRSIGAKEDDLKLLIAKRFLLTFEDGVIVIKHWRMHNTLSSGRYHETQYIEEKSQLLIKENGAYSFNSGTEIDDKRYAELGNRRSKKTNVKQVTNKCQASDEQMQNSDLDLDLDLDKDINITVSKDTVRQTETVRQAIDAWNLLENLGIKSVSKISSGSKRYKSLVARINQYGIEDVLKAIDNIKKSQFLQGHNGKSWTITFDWFVTPNNFPKVLDGNYEDKEGVQSYERTRPDDDGIVESAYKSGVRVDFDGF